MKLNVIATGIHFLGTSIKNLKIENTIVDIKEVEKRNFGININEPRFEKEDDLLYAQISIDFEIEIFQSDNEKCNINLTIEGAFASNENISENAFKELVVVNGASALIGIARGKIEGISANVFNSGKIVIPFVNVLEYYKSLEE